MMQHLHEAGTLSSISGLQPLSKSDAWHVRVLIRLDSALVRSLLDRTLRDDPGTKVAGSAANGLQGIEAVRAGAINVVVLDIEMPVLDGLSRPRTGHDTDGNEAGRVGRFGADGGTVRAQDEASSVLWGTPGAVARARLCRSVLPTADLGAQIVRFAGKHG